MALDDYYTSNFVRRRKSGGNWSAVLSYKEGGVWKTISKSTKTKKKSEAKKIAQQWQDEENAKIKGLMLSSELDDRTVLDVVNEYQDIQLAKGEIEQSTHYRYKKGIKNHIETHTIGSVMFTSLNRVMIETWLADLAKKGLKQSSISQLYAAISKVYAYYYRIEEIQKNPFHHVKRPPKSKAKVSYLDNDQLQALIVALNENYEEGSPFWTAVNLVVLDGFRRAEMCGLRWNEVDFNYKKVRITTSIGVTNKTYTKPPKNESSVRELNMTPQTEEVLRARQAYIVRNGLSMEPSDFVISDTDTYVHPATLTHQMNKFTHANDLVDHYGQYVTLHNLRHNFATTGVRAKLDIASLAKMLGHHDKAMTLNTYASDSPEAMKKASEMLSKAFSAENPDIYGV